MPDSSSRKILQAFRLGRALRLVWQSSPGWTIANTSLLIVQGLLPLGSLYLMKLVVDEVAIAISAIDKGEAFSEILLLIALAGAVTLVANLCNAIAEFSSEAHAQIVSDRTSELLHLKSIEVDLEYYENPQYHDALHRAQQEASFRPTSVLMSSIQLGQQLISSFALVGLLLSLHWAIASISLVCVLPGTLLRLRYSSQMYRWGRQRTKVERQASYLNRILASSDYAKEIRLFNLGSLFSGRFRNLRGQIRQERLQIAVRHSIAQSFAQFSSTLAVFGSYAFIAYQTVRGEMTLGDLVMYHQAFGQLQNSLKGVLSSLASLYSHNLFLANLYEFLDLEPKITEPAHPQPVPQPIRKGIVFHRVSFQYANSSRTVLKDIDLEIRPKEVIALVGENGSGKTTLIKLLCRLYDPTSGSISADGIDLRSISPTAWRAQIGVVFQDYVRYNFSARDNIWLGNIESPSDSEKIAIAARRAGADRAIASLPQGYETILGTLFEGGEELSIGQWQKVAMARAFLRDSQLIILDEPSSALDPKAEAEVFENFRKLLDDRSAILISHRLSSVKMADCIYVLDEGKIVEKGTHDRLIQLGGIYARMFDTQARNYR